MTTKHTIQTDYDSIPFERGTNGNWTMEDAPYNLVDEKGSVFASEFVGDLLRQLNAGQRKGVANGIAWSNETSAI